MANTPHVHMVLHHRDGRTFTITLMIQVGQPRWEARLHKPGRSGPLVAPEEVGEMMETGQIAHNHVGNGGGDLGCDELCAATQVTESELDEMERQWNSGDLQGHAFSRLLEAARQAAR